MAWGLLGGSFDALAGHEQAAAREAFAATHLTDGWPVRDLGDAAQTNRYATLGRLLEKSSTQRRNSRYLAPMAWAKLKRFLDLGQRGTASHVATAVGYRTGAPTQLIAPTASAVSAQLDDASFGHVHAITILSVMDKIPLAVPAPSSPDLGGGAAGGGAEAAASSSTGAHMSVAPISADAETGPDPTIQPAAHMAPLAGSAADGGTGQSGVAPTGGTGPGANALGQHPDGTASVQPHNTAAPDSGPAHLSPTADTGIPGIGTGAGGGTNPVTGTAIPREVTTAAVVPHPHRYVPGTLTQPETNASVLPGSSRQTQNGGSVWPERFAALHHPPTHSTGPAMGGAAIGTYEAPAAPLAITALQYLRGQITSVGGAGAASVNEICSRPVPGWDQRSAGQLRTITTAHKYDRAVLGWTAEQLIAATRMILTMRQDAGELSAATAAFGWMRLTEFATRQALTETAPAGPLQALTCTALTAPEDTVVADLDKELAKAARAARQVPARVQQQGQHGTRRARDNGRGITRSSDGTKRVRQDPPPPRTPRPGFNAAAIGINWRVLRAAIPDTNIQRTFRDGPTGPDAQVLLDAVNTERRRINAREFATWGELLAAMNNTGKNI